MIVLLAEHALTNVHAALFLKVISMLSTPKLAPIAELALAFAHPKLSILNSIHQVKGLWGSEFSDPFFICIVSIIKPIKLIVII